MELNFSNIYYNQIVCFFTLVLPPSQVMAIAVEVGLVQRVRDFRPDILLLAVFDLLDNSPDISIARLYSRYDSACCECSAPTISQMAFWKQINKDQLEAFAKRLFEVASKQCCKRQVTDMADVLALIQQKVPIEDIVASDGSIIRLRDKAAKVYGQGDSCKGIGGTCQKKVHGTFSLSHQAMLHAAITKGTGAERPQVPVHLLRYCLWLADAGYVSHDLFKAIADGNGFFLVREKQDMNPLVKSVTIYEGTKFIRTKVFDQPIRLKDLGPSYNLQRTYDMEVVLSNGLTCRAIKCFNPNKSKRSEGEDEFAYFCTNLTKDLFDFEQVLAIYQARWGIEIDWKNT